MNSSARPKGISVSATEEVIFEFQNLEITQNALVIHFFEEKTIISLKDIMSYRFNWYLHDPIFAKKCAREIDTALSWTRVLLARDIPANSCCHNAEQKVVRE